MKRFLERLFSIELFLALCYVCLLLGMTLPYGVPLFTPLVLIYFTVYVVKGLLRANLTIQFNDGFKLFYLCIIMYFIGLAWSSSHFNRTNLVDLKNLFALVLIAFMLGDMTRDKFKQFVKIYNHLAVVILSFSALVAAYHFAAHLMGLDLRLLGVQRGKAFIGVSLSGSYNMFALAIFAGVLAGHYCFMQTKSLILKFFYLSSILLMISVILMTGSRRAWVIMSILFFYLFCKIIFKNIAKIYKSFGKLKVNSIKTSISVILFIFCIAVGFSLTKDSFRVVRLYELNKLKYRLDTIFSRKGSIPEALSKRTERWDYAGDLVDRSSLVNLLFGQGFDYLRDYSMQFHADRGEDNPHNIFISAFIYSGIFGFFALTILIFFTCFKLLNEWQNYGEHFVILFLITVVSVSVGANSLFSVRLLPLIIISILSIDFKNSSIGPPVN